MKLAKRASMLTLILLTLVFVVPAQSQSDARSEKDNRNTAPTVGTGGAIGGPTGLFTVYDSQTLRKGEYTLSFALSNYDRDPGNVDITSVPISFQVGLTNKFELFFGTEAYRGVKVNSPRNLSSFYLPNSQVPLTGALRVAPAIVLSTGTGTSAIFRPPNAPVCAFPYTGCRFFNPTLLGISPTLGPPRAGSGGASLFPGVGSPFGSILPGPVFTTGVRPDGSIVPVSFSATPTYMADAPFINRTWGTSTFNSIDVGFKYRLNSLNAGWGHSITAFWRWYMDHADDTAGFNMMQRGAGPGSEWGDFGAVYAIDARPANWLNVGANVGYKFTTKTKSDIFGGDFTLFDPGDEFHWAVSADFPVNKYFQPILEFRQLYYVRSRTPNALENDPADGLAGVRIFPRRWFGFSFAYRHHFNQQDFESFEDDRTTSSVSLLCPPGSPAACAPTTISSTFTGLPPGVQASSDPHGYIAQFFIGRRDKRQAEIVNQPANVDSVTIGDTVITLPCPPGTRSRSGACNDSTTVSVATRAIDPENDVLTYNYTVSGGRIVGTGANVQWDLSGAQAGTYTITTGVDDGCGVCGRTNTQTIRVEACPDCEAPRPECPTCPTVTVTGPAGITSPGSTMTFTASVSGDATYNWTVSRGTIESGQGTPSITVRTSEADAGQNVTATVSVEVRGAAECPPCPSSASETAGVAARPESRIIDEFGKVANDDLKARIDNLYVQLGNEPGAQGYIINYGPPAEIRRRKAVINAHIRMRQLDASRVTMIDGPDTGAGISTKIYIVPQGATPPQP